MIMSMLITARPQQRYDHGLRNIVQRTSDVTVATDLGVPRSTAGGWLRAAPTAVICLDVADLAARAAGETARAESMRRKVSNTVRELESVQPFKIALNQKSDARGERTRRKTPVQRCAVLLDTAPPGHAAWTLPHRAVFC
jgi:hypothetical protein